MKVTKFETLFTNDLDHGPYISQSLRIDTLDSGARASPSTG
jgi:hypothetical protein